MYASFLRPREPWSQAFYEPVGNSTYYEYIMFDRKKSGPLCK